MSLLADAIKAVCSSPLSYRPPYTLSPHTHMRAHTHAHAHALEVGVDARVAAGSQDGIIMRVWLRAFMQLPLRDPNWTPGAGWV